MPIESVLAAGLPLVGQGVASLFGARQAKKQNQANRELAEYQYSKDVEMWNLNNAYNSPKAQMERLKQAGLNPNLVYGTSAVVGNSSDTPQYSAPSAVVNTVSPVTPDSSDVVSRYQNTEQKSIQMAGQKQQMALVAQELKNRALQNSVIAITAQKGLWDLEKDKQMFPSDMALKQAQINKLQNEIDGIMNKNKLFPIEEELLKLGLQKEGTNVDLLEEEIKGKRADRNRTYAETSRIIEQAKAEKYNNILRDAGIDPNSPWWVKFGKAKAEKIAKMVTSSLPYWTIVNGIRLVMGKGPIPTGK